jgi:hypothetical protein
MGAAAGAIRVGLHADGGGPGEGLLARVTEDVGKGVRHPVEEGGTCAQQEAWSCGGHGHRRGGN